MRKTKMTLQQSHEAIKGLLSGRRVLLSPELKAYEDLSTEERINVQDLLAYATLGGYNVVEAGITRMKCIEFSAGKAEYQPSTFWCSYTVTSMLHEIEELTYLPKLSRARHWDNDWMKDWEAEQKKAPEVHHHDIPDFIGDDVRKTIINRLRAYGILDNAKPAMDALYRATMSNAEKLGEIVHGATKALEEATRVAAALREVADALETTRIDNANQQNQ